MPTEAIEEIERKRAQLKAFEDDEFRKAGGFGRFQISANLIIIFGILSGSQVLYNLWYFQMRPLYECQNAGESKFYQCKREEFCGNQNINWRVDYTKEESLNNWVQQLDLHCIGDNELGFIGSSFFIGAFIGSIIIPRLADIYGRKKPYMFGLILYALTSLIYPFSTSLYLNYFLIFLGGISEAGRYYVGFVYLQELMPTTHQTYVGINIFMAHGFAKLCYDLYFYQITKNWVYLNYSAIVMAFTCIICMQFMPESPRYLLSSNQKEEAEKSFETIAKFNRVSRQRRVVDLLGYNMHDQKQRLLGDDEKDKDVLLQQEKKIGDVKKVESVKKLFQETSYLVNLLIMIFSWSTASFGFYLIPYFLSSINTQLQSNSYNVFELAIASSISEIFANIFCYFITTIFPNKKSLIFSYLLAFFGSAGFWIAKDTVLRSSNILYYVLFSKFGVTVAFNVTYVIMGELFPTLLKATAFGICNVIARFITILSPIIALLEQPYPMLIFSLSCLIAGLFGILLKPLYH
ncbi:organic cation [Stylonychia lemnae]|uniref:Organic cation n=1 Tax=Stylonychia lemnae TaxID=5949 RepID=A0A078AGI0_STYLE|nr:organic cation [Stylonychia lemnae]|eukprot:CDW80647.1 organic cation [Stylonychia lemnae]